MKFSEKTKNRFYISMSLVTMYLMAITTMSWWWIASGVAAVALVVMVEIATNGPFMLTQEKIMMGIGMSGFGILLLAVILLVGLAMALTVAWEDRKIWMGWIEKKLVTS